MNEDSGQNNSRAIAEIKCAVTAIEDKKGEALRILDVREKIITASAQLVKKQMTWINAFKSKSYQHIRLENAEDALKSCVVRALESL